MSPTFASAKSCISASLMHLLVLIVVLEKDEIIAMSDIRYM
jgi:hypothetical protein